MPMRCDWAGRQWSASTFIGQLTAESRAELLALGVLRTYKSGSALILEGEETSTTFLILTGRVRITARAGRNREALLSFRNSGDLVGELSALDRQPRSATVSASGVVSAVELGATTFARFVDGHPDARLALTRMVAGRLRAATRSRKSLSGSTVLARVSQYLADVGGLGGDVGPDRTIPVTQPQIADAVGASESSVFKALQRLREEHIVSVRRGEIRIEHPDRLRELANDS